ncbi:MAG: dTDP-4-dehydrorhamnose 3,5-epimerase [Pseudomonadota bacterium]
MEVTATELPGVVRLQPRRFGDSRGWFAETWNAQRMADAGFDNTWVQDNQSASVAKGTVRGLHYQAPPSAQAKLVRVLKGAVLDVAVDVRRGSPTFGKWVREELSAANGAQLLIPRGFLHGFVTLEDDTEVAYKVDAFFDPVADGAVRFDDPDLAVDWGLSPDTAILSDKDAGAPLLADWTSPFEWEAP